MTDEQNRRTETARRNDDSELTEGTETPDQQGRSGGGVAKAVGVRGEHKRVDDPDTSTGVDNADERSDGVKPNETGGTG